jgi:hypothetical protein
MTTTDYLINIALIGIVVIQLRTRRMDLRSLLLPVVLVILAASYYLKGVPTSGNDVLLDVVTGGVGLALGAACALTTSVWRGSDGYAYTKAGAAAAALWVLGVGFRFGFEEYSEHGGAGAIARFSVSHSITSANAWTAALVIMALSEVVVRLVVLRLRGSQIGRRVEIGVPA